MADNEKIAREAVAHLYCDNKNCEKCVQRVKEALDKKDEEIVSLRKALKALDDNDNATS